MEKLCSVYLPLSASVVNPSWLFTIKWILPSTVKCGASDNIKVSATTPCINKSMKIKHIQYTRFWWKNTVLSFKFQTAQRIIHLFCSDHAIIVQLFIFYSVIGKIALHRFKCYIIHFQILASLKLQAFFIHYFFVKIYWMNTNICFIYYTCELVVKKIQTPWMHRCTPS